MSDHTVRAATVHGRSVRTADEPLEPGIVVQGEVVDVAALADAIKRLWATGRFGGRNVVIGLAGRDAVTRRIEIPDMSDRDLRSALQFELTDVLPFSPSEAVLDVVRIETEIDEREVAVARVLAVAVHRQCVEPLVAAVRAAKLRPVRADMVSFGLVRAASVAGPRLGGPRALVHVGGSSLSVVVHTEGLVRFTRRVAVATTEAADAADLEADLQFVERYRNRDRAGASGGTATLVRTDPIVAAIAGTIEYHSIQPGSLPLAGVDLIGDLERASNLVEALEGVLGQVVDVRTLDEHADDDPGGLAAAARGRFAPAIGVVLRPGDGVVGPAPLDLMPPPAPVPGRAVALRAAVIGGAALLAGAGLGHVLGPDDVAVAEEADSAEGVVAATQARLGGLSQERADALALKQGRSRLEAALAERVPWEILVGRIRASTPADTTLLSISGRAAQSSTTGRIPGEIELTAQAPTAASASAWLTTLGDMAGVRRPWLSSSATEDDDGVAGQATFSITVELEDDFGELLATTPGAATDEEAQP